MDRASDRADEKTVDRFVRRPTPHVGRVFTRAVGWRRM